MLEEDEVEERVYQRLKIDLNRGQKLGDGKVAMLFPGLNAPITRGEHVVQQARLPDDPNRQQHLQQLQLNTFRRKRVKLHPLDRGWSGGIMGGRKIGPPDPIHDGLHLIY